VPSRLDKRHKLTLASCCGVHSLQDGLSAAIYVLLPILAQSFGLSYSQVGIVRAANISAMMLFEIPSGMLSERIGERSLLVFGLVCAGLGYLSLAAATGFMTILLALFVSGFGAAFQHALSSSVISKTFQASGRRTALGAYNSSGDVGKLVFTGLLSLAIGMGVAWQGVVTGFGLLALISAVGLFAILRQLDVSSRPLPDGREEKTSGEFDWGVRDRRAFTALAVIVFLDIAVQGGFLTFVAFLMIEKEVPTGLAALAVVLTLAGGIFGKFGCGLLADRVGVIRSLIVVECLTAAGIVSVLLSPAMVAFFLLPVLGLVLQGSSSITYATVGDLVRGERQSRGFAAIYSIASGGAILAPIAFGVISDRFGLTTTMVTMACTVLLLLPLCTLLRPTLARRYA